MPARSFYPNQWNRQAGVHRMSGRFVTNETANPTAITGAGYTIAYSATGVLTLTMDQKFSDYITAHAQIIDNTADSSERLYIKSISANPGGTSNASMVLQGQSGAGTAAALETTVVLWSVDFVYLDGSL